MKEKDMTETIRVGTAASMAGGYPDQVVEPQEPIAMATVMDDVREALAEKVEIEIFETVVPARSKFMMLYKADIDYDELKLWMKRSKESKHKDAPVDMKRLSTIILINTCVGMKYNCGTADNPVWMEVFGQRDGRPMTFHSVELQEMLKATIGGTYDAVQKMYVHDGHIILVAQTLGAKAGYTDLDVDGDTSDPLGS
jgi:hypothetical protein